MDPDYVRAFEVSNHVLCVSPHPDDCEIGAGGTLARMVSRGAIAYLVVVTDESRGTYKPGIAEEAARALGLAGICWVGVRDGELNFDRTVLEKLVTVIRVTKPDLVLIPDPYLHYEAHPDHYYTGRLASVAVVFSGLPLFAKSGFEQPHAPRFVAYYTSKPNTIVDVSDFVEKKIEALRKHKSQFTNGYVLNLILKYMEVAGKRIGVRYAEEFKVLPRPLLHVAPFAEYV